ncbi:hypothetical protein HY345_02690 [Candidatus Microgenomates bacterium]|nr:hypothetical protein [Candidatus Microgenomates bacterium]
MHKSAVRLFIILGFFILLVFLLINKQNSFSIHAAALKEVVFGLGGYDPIAPNDPLRVYTTDLGVKYKTTNYDWGAIEPTPGVYQWNKAGGTDAQVEGCNTILGVPCGVLMYGAPLWAVTKSNQTLKEHYEGGGNPYLSNSNYYCAEAPLNMDVNDNSVVEHYKEYVKRAVERYDGDGIDDAKGKNGQPLLADTFVLYNEPDWYQRNCGQAPWNSRDWNDINKDADLNQNGRPDYQDYAVLLKEFYQAVKQANPQAKVSFGTYGNFDQHDLRYTRNFGQDDKKTFFYKVLSYSQNFLGGQYFDLMNTHYYELYHCNQPWPKYDSYSVGSIRGQIAWQRAIMSQFSINKPIVITEIGDPVPREEYPEKIQAINVFKLLSQAASAGVEYTNWFDLLGWPANGSEYQYGLIDKNQNYRKRPSYLAYQIIAKGLEGYGFNSLDNSNMNNLEGYLFSPVSSSNKILKEVLWSVPTRPTFCPVPYYPEVSPGWDKARVSRPAPTIQKKFSADSLEIQDSFGMVNTIYDGQAGDQDGKKDQKVTINLTSMPLMVSFVKKSSGDANSDGKVDGADYVVWLNYYGKTTPNKETAGDFNLDTKVDGLDYAIWLINYGN